MNISKKLLFGCMGWKVQQTVEIPQKCILAVAPHTSNWDFVIGILYSRAVGLKSQFLMKKEWFFWPLGPLFRNLGGVPVYRSKHTSMTDNMANMAKESDTFRLCITPEGTRSRTTEWKRGFYYIALKANIPIVLYGLDYKRKLISCEKVITPTGDIDKEMVEIKNYFASFTGKHSEKFAI